MTKRGFTQPHFSTHKSGAKGLPSPTLEEKKKSGAKGLPSPTLEEKKKSGAGFTLIEMMVVVAIFSLMVGTIMEIFMWGIREQRRALATQKLLDETSYVSEYMSRSIRMAIKDDIKTKGVTKNCLPGEKLNFEVVAIPGGGGASGLMFRDYQNRCKGFFLDGTQLKEYDSERISNKILPLTSSNLEVVSFRIGPSDSWDQDDNDQPRVTIFLEIKAKAQGLEAQPGIKIQTTISQRNLDIQY